MMMVTKLNHDFARVFTAFSAWLLCQERFACIFLSVFDARCNKMLRDLTLHVFSRVVLHARQWKEISKKCIFPSLSACFVHENAAATDGVFIRILSMILAF